MPGDGIGPEVMAVATGVLEQVARRSALDMTLERLPWPSHRWYREHGEMMPADALDRLAAYDALLMGALGDPGPGEDSDRHVLPDSVSLEPLLRIRKGFDLWACERPAVWYEGAPRYLADPRAAEVDMLVIRENSEGEYVGQGGRLRPGTPHEVATALEVFTRRGAERIIRHAFERARERAAARNREGRPGRRFQISGGRWADAEVCLVTKRNALGYWGEMYSQAFADIAKDYPDIATHHELVDAACMKFVTAPWRFDVVVASNLHGDILTDLAAVLCGGMGVAPSSNINPGDRSKPPLFEPTHGSGPDIAGKDLAGPHAMLLTVAMMLDWMGIEDARAAEAAGVLRVLVAEDMARYGTQGRRTSEVEHALQAALAG